MAVLMKLCIALVLLLVECKGEAPTITPAGPEVVINEGDPFEMTCTAENVIFSHHPDPKKFITSEFTEEKYAVGETHTYKLKKEHTESGDSGWYGCGNDEESVKERKKEFHDKSTWIYLFVKSKERFFVKKTDLTAESVKVGNDYLFDCRPTSPDYKVEFFGPNNEAVTTGDRVDWCPKRGFMVKNITNNDIGLWKCKITVDGTTQELTFNIGTFDILR